MKRTYIYIDGFNLYYALKETPYKWLDINKLSENLLPLDIHIIKKIKYFTALVKPKEDDPSCKVRQNIYLRALRTVISKEDIYLGRFSFNVKRARLVKPSEGKKFRQVFHTEEKGSDVNIAIQMLLDGFQNKYDVAVLISNDSDFLMLVKAIKKDIGIVFPHKRQRSIALKKMATFHKEINLDILKASQFPSILEDTRGLFYKPKSW